MAASRRAWHTSVVTKPTSKRAGKTGAKSKKKTTARRGAKPRKARALRPPSDDAQAEQAMQPSVPSARERRREALSEAAARHAELVAWRKAAAGMTREAWTMQVKDAKQRILADVVAKVCAVFGVSPDALKADRKDQSPRSRNENSLRGMALGAIVEVGIAMGLGWNELHTHHEIGRSEVIDLPPHAATIRGAYERWLAVQQSGEGVVMSVMRREVEAIKASAVTGRK